MRTSASNCMGGWRSMMIWIGCPLRLKGLLSGAGRRIYGFCRGKLAHEIMPFLAAFKEAIGMHRRLLHLHPFSAYSIKRFSPAMFDDSV